ncbi:unnamed protein product [Moneuplotes crassus]|uniref:Uncharacterized protein n=1 Tax=Euplotes crassus TaxID=5936 RepID=A0AAD2D7G6_EUPCR|nr:unnamed protein product [Moneuplotes crassus]
MNSHCQGAHSHKMRPSLLLEMNKYLDESEIRSTSCDLFESPALIRILLSLCILNRIGKVIRILRKMVLQDLKQKDLTLLGTPKISLRWTLQEFLLGGLGVKRERILLKMIFFIIFLI